MTDLLCNWLNTEVKLSTKIAPTNFAREFASGFLLGELLHKFGLQNDFDQFSQNRTSEAKLNNFTRLEPKLHLLNVSFDTNIARDVMTEKQESATRLLYELFVVLTKKQKNNLTGIAMETMRPAAPAKLEGITSTMYRERLKHLTPRQTDLNLDMMMTRFHQKQRELEQTAFKERFEEEERRQRQLQDQRLQLIQQLKDNRDQKSETLAKILEPRKCAANVNIPKPPPNKTAKAIAMKRNQKKQIAIEEMTKEMTMFDMKLQRSMTSASMGDHSKSDGEYESKAPQRIATGKESANDDYLKKLKQTAAENKAARLEREKRRRKVLFEQLRAQEAQEEEKRETILVSFLMRQSLQERRIATQLLHVRHEKQVICNNRLMREKQFEERRLQEFQLALDKEAEMSRLAKIEYEEQMRHSQDLHDRIMAERAQEKYAKHYDFCYEAVSDTVDLVTKIGEYRELTNQLIPAKLMRDWMDIFIAGQPQYVVQEMETEQGELDEERPQEQLLNELRNQLLNETDFEEYKLMCGEWSPPEASQVTGPPKDNPVLGHVVHRLLDMVHPDPLASAAPQFPSFPIKACILGKSFSGKTTCAMKLKESHNLEVLSIDKLLNEAIRAFQEGEVFEEEYTVRPEENVVETGSGSIAHSASLDEQLDPTGAASAVSVASGSHREVTPDQAISPSPSTQGRTTEGSEQDTNIPSTTDQQSHEEKNPEKPYFEEIKIREVPTGRAQLGEKALKCLTQGKAVDDEILVNIIVETIRNLPVESGWVLDGFPVRFSQLMLLEKALTGFDMTEAESPDDLERLNAEKKPKKSQLVSNPHPHAPPPEPKSGINVVIELDLPDDICLKRSAGRFYGAEADCLYQQEFKPPPAGSITGLGSQEMVVPVHDVAHDQEQIHHRLSAFVDEWPKLTKWFGKYGHLVTIDADQSEDVLLSQVSDAVDDTLQKLEGGVDELELVLAEEKPPEEIPPPEPVKSVEVVPESPAEGHKSRQGARSGSGERLKSGSASSRNKMDKSSSRGNSPKSPQKSPKPAKSPKKGGKGKKEPEPEPEPVEPTGPPPPQPGSSEWVYVNQPIDMELANVLVSYWETTEASYMTSSKDVFQLIRDEREQIIRYLFQNRVDFKEYLSRPDFKQEFITQWQKNYNEVRDELRDDEDMKADLHQRVDDLRERLWNISDERKENAEKERARVMANGWVDDHTGILSNHYISLMQVELDRFQDAVHLLQDYYRGMEGRVPDETSSDFARIPLLEVLPTESPTTPSKGDPKERAQSAVVSPSVTELEGGKKSVTPVGRKKKTETQETTEEKRIIPLIPRRPGSPDAITRSKAEKAKGKGGKDVEDLPPPPQDLDEKLIYDVFVTALSSTEKIVAAEVALHEAEEEGERQRQVAKEAERKKQEAAERKRAGRAGKAGADGKKSRSPSPKKGKGKEAAAEETPLTAASEETEEEKQKKIDKEKGKQEYLAAIMEEASAAKCRINLIRCISSLILQEMKTKVDATYNVLNDWIGDEFLKEMASIDELTEVLRNAIETSSKLYEELTLQKKDFVINRDAKLGRSPSPLPLPEVVEESLPDSFTIQQIKALYDQFSVAAPNGILPIKSFQEMIQTMAALAHHAELLPESWLTLTNDKLEQISQQLSADHEYIDWHSFLLQVSQPWPMPSQSQLLDTLRLFHEMDQKSQGTVTREQFNEVNLWLKESSETLAPSDTADRFDRMAHLIAAFFDVFADHSKDPPLVNYVDMLLYFAMAPDPFEGFLRALTVVMQQHMPRLAKKKLLSRKQQTSDGVEELDKQTEEEGKVVWPGDIPESAIDARVTLNSILKVLLHGKSQHGEYNRFILNSASDSEYVVSQDRLANIFMDLGAEDGQQPLPLTVLLEHPVMQDLVYGCTAYKAIDLKAILMAQGENAVTELAESPVA